MRQTLTPVEPPFTEEIGKILSRYPQDGSGHILKLFRVFARSKRFLTSKGVNNLLDKESPLSLREREIVILRVTANNHCEYEWGIHAAIFAKAAKLTPDQVKASRLGKWNDTCWPVEDQLLIKCVDELETQKKLSDDTYDAFQNSWTAEQQLEILALCGNYHLISLVANTARIEPEDEMPCFPSASTLAS